jgi:hypothetical protein
MLGRFACLLLAITISSVGSSAQPVAQIASSFFLAPTLANATYPGELDKMNEVFRQSYPSLSNNS